VSKFNSVIRRLLNEQRAAESNSALKPMGILESTVIFGSFSILLWAAIYQGIPWIRHEWNLPLMMCWFISGSIIALIPMILFAVAMGWRESSPSNLQMLKVRLRISRPSAADTFWVIAGLLLVVFFTALVFGIARYFKPDFLPVPPFMEVPHSGLIWIIIAWIPLFVCNIIGEELCWRGYVLPRQQAAFGRFAWLVNGAMWFLFHWSIGFGTMLLILPTCFVVPAIVQRSQNTTVGILIHGIFNAAGFIGTVTGLMRH
jgi:membrane protease YdiL (CAAX protease family)